MADKLLMSNKKAPRRALILSVDLLVFDTLRIDGIVT